MNMGLRAWPDQWINIDEEFTRMKIKFLLSYASYSVINRHIYITRPLTSPSFQQSNERDLAARNEPDDIKSYFPRY
jgi:hypothetical protein